MMKLYLASAIALCLWLFSLPGTAAVTEYTDKHFDIAVIDVTIDWEPVDTLPEPSSVAGCWFCDAARDWWPQWLAMTQDDDDAPVTDISDPAFFWWD